MSDAYRDRLLASLGLTTDRIRGSRRVPDHERAAALWARSGAMALTGPRDGPPSGRPVAVAAAAAGAWDAFRALLPRAAGTDVELSEGETLELDAPALLGERAAIAGLKRAGTISPGGSCRLVAARGGWLAVNLARADDVDLLPAWLGGDRATSDAWGAVAEGAAEADAAALEERAVLLGMAVARVRPAPHPRSAQARGWFRIAAVGRPNTAARRRAPLVADLSSLWAGPLCTHLLSLAGARVVKVESTRRPDGARAGPPAFFDLLNAGKQSVALDFTDAGDRARLRRLVSAADIVVESSRPRALAQLGIDAERTVEQSVGITWISITGYGRGAGANRVAFGDDAAAAAGLAAAAGSESAPLFCADAVADPLTGLHAALAALASWRAGGGRLFDIALRDVAAHALAFGDGDGDRAGGARPAAPPATPPAAPPRARPVTAHAAALGADTDRVLGALDARC